MIDDLSIQHPANRPGGAAPMPLRQFASLTKASAAAPVFAIASGKGGVGKTNVVANLAVLLARSKKRVLAIDADLGLANLDLFLGIKPQATLADFFSGQRTLDEIIVRNSDGILLLPGGSGIQEITALRREQKIALLTEFDALSHEMDVVLVDTASGISDAVTYFTSSSQQIVVVVTPEPTSMTDAYALIKVLVSTHHQKRFWILPNNVADENEARRLFDTLSGTALRFLNASLDLITWIPRDPLLLRAVARSRPVVAESAEAPSAKAFARLARRLNEIAAAGMNINSNPQFFLRRWLQSGSEA
jgi:flagellar biosynthesis protein FlhG